MSRVSFLYVFLFSSADRCSAYRNTVYLFTLAQPASDAPRDTQDGWFRVCVFAFASARMSVPRAHFLAFCFPLFPFPPRKVISDLRRCFFTRKMRARARGKPPVERVSVRKLINIADACRGRRGRLIRLA